MTEPEIDKNIIDVTVYEINRDTKLYAYTALWCGPCKRIKPKLIETMSKHNYKIIEETVMQKSDFKKVVKFVPFFVVMRKDEIVDSIQSSDETLFTQFLGKNGITKLELDDNF